MLIKTRKPQGDAKVTVLVLQEGHLCQSCIATLDLGSTNLAYYCT